MIMDWLQCGQHTRKNVPVSEKIRIRGFRYAIRFTLFDQESALTLLDRERGTIHNDDYTAKMLRPTF